MFNIRYMSSNNIPSERAIRKKQKVLLKDHLEGKTIQLLFNSNAADGVNGMKLKDTPFVYVKDIGAMILDHLDRHDQ